MAGHGLSLSHSARSRTFLSRINFTHTQALKAHFRSSAHHSELVSAGRKHYACGNENLLKFPPSESAAPALPVGATRSDSPTPNALATPISPEFRQSLETEYSTQMEERRKAWASLTVTAKESVHVIENLLESHSQSAQNEGEDDYIALLSQAYKLANRANKYKRVNFYWQEALHQAEKYQLQLVTESDREWLAANAQNADRMTDAALRVANIVIEHAEARRDGKPLGSTRAIPRCVEELQKSSNDTRPLRTTRSGTI